MLIGVLSLCLGFALPQPFEFTSALAIGSVGASGRTTLHTDAIESMIVNGTWKTPSDGDTVKLPNGSSKNWTPIRANTEGWFDDSRLRGGYVSLRHTAVQPEILKLRAVGSGVVYVNGEIRAGDPYSTGAFAFPIQIRAGDNEFLVAVSRGRLRATLEPIASPQYIEDTDPTLPDIIVNRPGSLLASVIVGNATNQWNRSLRLRAYLTDASGPYRPYETDCGSIPPLSIKKCGFEFRVPAISAAVPHELTVELFDKNAKVDTKTFTIRIRKPNETYRVTFTSKIDGSVQYYAVTPSLNPSPGQALFLSLHGASVEAQGQAEAYSSKAWGSIVCPTNRRPFGFDWEDWGRADAMEVLEHSTRSLRVDPSRIYLTGHSMGGHGTWQLGVQFPDRFAAIGPSAGWSSFYSYGGKPRLDVKNQAAQIITRAESPSDTNALISNLDGVGVYVLHGDADDNVPVAEARAMTKLLAEFHRDWISFEQAKAGHWWDASEEPGADCVDWAPMFDFFARRALPPPDAVRRVRFKTAAPIVSATRNWVTIEQQFRPFEISSVDFSLDPLTRRIRGTTSNVRMIKFDLSAFPSDEKWKLTIDGHPDIEMLPSAVEKDQMWVMKVDQWRSCARPTAAVKNSIRSGPFKSAFDHSALLVVGTKGNAHENAWALAKARYDSETFLVRGNARFEVVRDVDLVSTRTTNRNLILYGNRDTNAAWSKYLKDSPIQLGKSQCDFSDDKLSGALSALFVRPRHDETQTCVAVIGGTNVVGMRLCDKIPFITSGVAIPDFLITNPSTLDKLYEGVLRTGFFDSLWQIDPQLSAKGD